MTDRELNPTLVVTEVRLLAIKKQHRKLGLMFLAKKVGELAMEEAIEHAFISGSPRRERMCQKLKFTAIDRQNNPAKRFLPQWSFKANLFKIFTNTSRYSFIDKLRAISAPNFSQPNSSSWTDLEFILKFPEIPARLRSLHHQ